MNENFIIVENVKQQDLERILMNLANLYADVEFAEGIQLYRKKGKGDSFLILFSNQPDFARFCYVVNYIKYPEEFEHFSPFLRGYFLVCDIKKKSELNKGEWIMVYVSKNDKAYDNVTLVNFKDENYLFDFGGRLKKIPSKEEMYKLLLVDKSNYYHLMDIVPSVPYEEPEVKPWWKFW